MLMRLISIAVVGFMLNGYAPRWLATGDAAWMIWTVAAAIVLAGPRLVRNLFRRILRSVGIVRLRSRSAVLNRSSAGTA